MNPYRRCSASMTRQSFNTSPIGREVQCIFFHTYFVDFANGRRLTTDGVVLTALQYRGITRVLVGTRVFSAGRRKTSPPSRSGTPIRSHLSRLSHSISSAVKYPGGVCFDVSCLSRHNYVIGRGEMSCNGVVGPQGLRSPCRLHTNSVGAYMRATRAHINNANNVVYVSFGGEYHVTGWRDTLL